MKDKRGFICMTFLGLFLILDLILALFAWQLSVRQEITDQMQRWDEQDRQLIRIQNWVRWQLENNSRCDGWQNSLQAEIYWNKTEVRAVSDIQEIILNVDETLLRVTDYHRVR